MKSQFYYFYSEFFAEAFFQKGRSAAGESFLAYLFFKKGKKFFAEAFFQKSRRKR